MNKRKIIIGCLLFIAIFVGCSSLPKTLLNSKIPSESTRYQVDFLELAKYIAKNNCGFYEKPLQNMTFEEYSLLVDEVYEKVGKIDNNEAFYIQLQWFVEKLNDGHTKVMYFPYDYAEVGGWWIGDKFYITSTSNIDLEHLLYKEVVKIGQLAPLDYEKGINDYIPADKGQLRYKRLFSPDLMLSKTYLKLFGLLNKDGTLSIEYLDGSTIKAEIVKCNKRNPKSYSTIMESCRNDITTVKDGNWYKEIADYSTYYIQLNSLPTGEQASFWSKLFKEVRDKNAKAIILDLRNNGGGSSVWCDEFLSYIVARDSNLYIYKGWQSNYPYGNTAVNDGLAPISAVNNGLHFGGKVILLTSPKTFSSATFFAVAIKDNKLGTLLGEPVGNASIRYGFNADPIVLTNTKLTFNTTHYIWARALPGAIEKEGTYILPNELIELSISDIEGKRDRVFERALEIIGKK